MVASSWLYSYLTSPARVEPVAVVGEYSTLHINPDPADVEAWFKSTHRVELSVPREFDYSLLAHYDLAQFQGKRVPMLLFIKGRERATVYILSRDQFDLDALSSEVDAQVSPYTLTFRPRSKGARIGYVIIFTGDSLAPFLAKSASGGSPATQGDRSV